MAYQGEESYAEAATNAQTYPEMESGDNPNQYVHNHMAPWNIYGIAFSSKKTNPFRLAVGSLLDSQQNYVRFGTDSRLKSFK